MKSDLCLAWRIGSIKLETMPKVDVNQARLFAGAMSGTSADGVDVVIARIEGSGLSMSARVVAWASVAYEEPLRRAIFEARGGGSIGLEDLARMGREITMNYVEAVQRAMKLASISPNDLVAIGAHGQTLFHAPPDSIQWIDPSLLAHKTGVAVVSDFRRADLAVGGQGAPLVPFADYVLFRDETKDVIALNVGGISNVTWLKRAGTIDEVVAFDCGPGVCLSDWLCRMFDPSGPGFDVDGQLALNGNVIDEVVDSFLGNAFFSKCPPKSTDGPAMVSMFEKSWKTLAPKATEVDLLATSARITARAIVDSMKMIPGFGESGHRKMLVGAGGGMMNRAIVREICARIEAMSIEFALTSEMNVSITAREALAFAILAAARVDGVEANVPGATGAWKRVLLGTISG